LEFVNIIYKDHQSINRNATNTLKICNYEYEGYD